MSFLKTAPPYVIAILLNLITWFLQFITDFILLSKIFYFIFSRLIYLVKSIQNSISTIYLNVHLHVYIFVFSIFNIYLFYNIDWDSIYNNLKQSLKWCFNCNFLKRAIQFSKKRCLSHNKFFFFLSIYSWSFGIRSFFFLIIIFKSDN